MFSALFPHSIFLGRLALSVIVASSGSPIDGIDHIRYALSQILLVGRLDWNFR
jgi:hypothetical protein